MSFLAGRQTAIGLVAIATVMLASDDARAQRSARRGSAGRAAERESSRSLADTPSETGAAAPRIAPIAAPTLALDLGGETLELVLVPAGRYRQGSPPREVGRRPDETAREVTLSEDFYLGKYPVTVGQFAAFVADTRYVTEAESGSSGGYGLEGTKLSQSKAYTWQNPGYEQTPRHPVTIVTYGDALAFTRWLGERTRRDVGLPTEAQWEYANRAGTTTRFYAGKADSVARKIGWFTGNAASGARAVGALRPNAFGLFDMSGNVYEWCRDWYGPYESGSVTDPERTAPPAGEKPRRVLRGGSFLRKVADLRAAARYRNDPGSRNADNGFRVVAGLTVASAPPPSRPAMDEPEPASPSPSPPARSGSLRSGMLYGLFGLIGLASAGVAIKGVLGSSRRLPRSGPSRDVSVRKAADGFWVMAPERLRGHTLRYRTKGQSAAVQLDPSPRGQFVYTGDAPGFVEVLQVSASALAAGAWGGTTLEEPAPVGPPEPVRAAVARQRYRRPSAY